MENDESQPATSAAKTIPQRARFEFSEPREPSIFFSSDFDSGNMHKVVKNSYDHYSIWTACDAQGTDHEGYPKSWFYFQVGGFSNRKVSFSVHRVHFLYAMAKRSQFYRPVFRIRYESEEVSGWERLPYPVLNLAINNDEQLVLKFDFTFNKLIRSVEFAFIYPYAYDQCREDILNLKAQHERDSDLFFQQCELTKSYEGRIIDLLVISSQEGRQGHEVTKGLPFSDQKIARFRNNKPIIFISARVHPIETPSSYTMTGIIQFLLDKKDMRAYLLRKYFVFVLVPMLNPDGVSRGHCRMDALNQNLNRYYTNPDPEKQPSCYAVKKLCEHYSRQKRLFMYLDLHAHPAYKGNFTFGNAIYEFIQQVESQLFPKLLSQNCISFEFEQCVFSRKHMKAKDKNEDISKEGCGRVVFYKEFGIVHSYTLQCGYHLNTFNNVLQQQTNTQNKFLVRYKLNDKGEKIYETTERQCDQEKLEKIELEIAAKDEKSGYDIFEHTSQELDDNQNAYYQRELPTYGPETFYNLGRNILISILDVWGKNPYSRVSDLNAHRRQIAQKQSKLDRFRKQQAGIKTKQKKIVQLIEEQFYGEWHKRNVFNANNTNQNRDKKRNQTLQLNKGTTLRQQRSEKSEKLPARQESKGIPNSETLIETDSGLPIRHGVIMLGRQQKNPSVASDNLLQSKGYFTRNFKVSRGKQTGSANQNDKQGNRATSINKEMLTGLKVGLEQELLRGIRQQGLSVSSKVIKNVSLGGNNLRVRNVVVGNVSLATAIKK